MRTLDYKELKERLAINKHCLDDELEQQSQIQHMISERVAKSREHTAMLEDELEHCEADTYIRAISKSMPDGKKPSVEYAKSMVKVDTIRKHKFVALNEARAELERWEGLYYAWRARNSAIESLSKLAVANYFAVETTYDKNREASSRHQSSRPLRRREPT